MSPYPVHSKASAPNPSHPFMDAVAHAHGFVPNLAGVVATSPALTGGYLTMMLEPGDGRVAKPSPLSRQTLDPTIQRQLYSFLAPDYSVMFCDGHDRLTGNINFQDNLLNILLSRDTRVPGQ